MKEPTKADLAAAVAKLTEENAGLRDLLAAVSEYAQSAPTAVYDDRWLQLSRATDVLTRISVVTDPDGSWAWGHASGEGAARLRELAAEPPGYEVYVKPEDDELHAEPVPLQIRDETIRQAAAFTEPGNTVADVLAEQRAAS